jgi:hypothetical protein
MKIKSTYTVQADVAVKDFLIELRNQYIKNCVPSYSYDFVNIDAEGFLTGVEDHSYRNTYIEDKIRQATPVEIAVLNSMQILLDAVENGDILSTL